MTSLWTLLDVLTPSDTALFEMDELKAKARIGGRVRNLVKTENWEKKREGKRDGSTGLSGREVMADDNVRERREKLMQRVEKEKREGEIRRERLAQERRAMRERDNERVDRAAEREREAEERRKSIKERVEREREKIRARLQSLRENRREVVGAGRRLLEVEGAMSNDAKMLSKALFRPKFRGRETYNGLSLFPYIHQSVYSNSARIFLTHIHHKSAHIPHTSLTHPYKSLTHFPHTHTLCRVIRSGGGAASSQWDADRSCGGHERVVLPCEVLAAVARTCGQATEDESGGGDSFVCVH